MSGFLQRLAERSRPGAPEALRPVVAEPFLAPEGPLELERVEERDVRPAQPPASPAPQAPAPPARPAAPREPSAAPEAPARPPLPAREEGPAQTAAGKGGEPPAALPSELPRRAAEASSTFDRYTTKTRTSPRADAPAEATPSLPVVRHEAGKPPEETAPPARPAPKQPEPAPREPAPEAPIVVRTVHRPEPEPPPREPRAAAGVEGAPAAPAAAPRPQPGPRPARRAAASPAPPPVEVSIGRVDVRAVFEPPAQEPAPAPSAAPAVSLDEYLQRRDAGA
jgi:hypothetical protein